MPSSEEKSSAVDFRSAREYNQIEAFFEDLPIGALWGGRGVVRGFILAAIDGGSVPVRRVQMADRFELPNGFF